MRHNVGFAPMLMGFLMITLTLNRPRLADMHNVDILSLVVAGMCIGAGLTVLIAGYRSRQSSRM